MSGPPGISIVDPIPNRIRTFSIGSRRLLCWQDSDHLIQNDYSNICIATSDKNILQEQSPRASGDRLPVSLAPTPAAAPQPYIGIIWSNGMETIAFFKKNFTIGKRVYSAPFGRDAQWPNALLHPRVDVTGDYIAWTQLTPSGEHRAAVKHVRDPESLAPTLIGELNTVFFCDWTESGDLLVNIESEGLGLAVYDRRGRFLRKITTATQPLPGVSASWRKYEHR